MLHGPTMEPTSGSKLTRFQLLYWKWQHPFDSASVYHGLRDGLVEGADGYTPDEARKALMDTFPFRRYAELFVRGVELPPVPPLTNRKTLQTTVWEEMTRDSPDAPADALIRCLFNEHIYPLAPNSWLDPNHPEGYQMPYKILLSNKRKMRMVDTHRRAYMELDDHQQRLVYHATHLAHPHWIGRAVTDSAYYAQLKRLSGTLAVAEAAVPADAGDDADADEDEEDEDEEEQDAMSI